MQDIRREMADGYVEFLQKFYDGSEISESIEKFNELMNNAMDKDLEDGDVVLRRIKIGRNYSCPCGSGKKFKKCCIFKAKKVF